MKRSSFVHLPSAVAGVQLGAEYAHRCCFGEVNDIRGALMWGRTGFWPFVSFCKVTPSYVLEDQHHLRTCSPSRRGDVWTVSVTIQRASSAQAKIESSIA